MSHAIAFSKIRIGLLLCASVGMMALGGWLLTLPDVSIAAQRRFNEPWLVHSVGGLSLLFFGVCSLMAGRKLLDASPGLVLSEQGLLDNASGVAAGFIPWSQITGIGHYQVQGQKMLVIGLADPKPYLERGPFWKKALLKANYRLVGSPVSIPANTLKMAFEPLLALVCEYHQRYGRSEPFESDAALGLAQSKNDLS